jgi:hypothetical protein
MPQAPSWQTSPPVQAFSQVPQWAASLWVSTHTPSQRVTPGPQTTPVVLLPPVPVAAVVLP